MQTEVNNDLIDERNASKLLGVSIHTLRSRRMLRKPPTFLKIGSLVKYRVSDLEAYLESCIVLPEESVE